MKVEYTLFNNKTRIHVFNPGHYVEQKHHQPYFYLKEKDLPFLYNINVNGQGMKQLVKKVSLPMVNPYDNQRIVRVVTYTPHMIGLINNEFKNRNIFTYEADVLYPVRTTIDLAIIPREKQNLLYFDCEMYTDEGGVPNWRNPTKPITAICVYSNILSKYVVLAFKKGMAKVEKAKGISYFIFETEEEMLAAFIKLWGDIRPTIVLGWNSVGFDLPYLYARMEVLGFKPSSLSPLNYTSMNNGVVRIKGVDSYDVQVEYKRMDGLRFEPSLAYASKRENVGRKLKGDTNKMYDNDFPTFLERCRSDTELTMKINEKKGLLDYHLSYHYSDLMSGVPLEHTRKASLLSDFLVLKLAKKLGYALPSKGMNVKKDSLTKKRIRISGAIVHNPSCGVHKNIMVMDYKTMYPTIVRSFNISTETRLKNKDICRICVNKNDGCKKEINVCSFFYPLDNSTIIDFLTVGNYCKQCRDFTPLNLNDKKFRCNGYKSENVCVNFKHPDYITLPNYQHYLKKEIKVGLTPYALDKLYMLRMRYKQKMVEIARVKGKKSTFYRSYNLRQKAVKFFTNAFSYGVSAYSGFRLYDVKTALTIVFMGRLLNMLMKKIIEGEYNYETVAGDTDSLMIKSKKNDLDEIIVEGKELTVILNKNLNDKMVEMGFKDTNFVVEFDKLYSSYLVGDAKKRYAGMISWEDGLKYESQVRDVKGFEAVKKNISPILVDVQNKTIELLLKDKKSNAHKYVLEIKEKIKKGDYDNKYLAQPQSTNYKRMYTKTQPFHLIAKENTQSLLNRKIPPNQIAYVLKVKSSGTFPFPKGGWISFTDDFVLPEDFRPDDEYYLNAVDLKVKLLFEVANLSLSGTMQKRLDII